MRVLLIGLKKKNAGLLDKRLIAEGFTTVIPASLEPSNLHAALHGVDLAVVDSREISDEEHDLIREALGHNPGLPLILLLGETGNGEAEYARVGFLPVVLREPYTLDDLSGKIKTILPVIPEEGARVLRAGDLTADLASRTVAFDDKQVTLTPKEMSLFEYFLKNPNQVLSRATLLRDVWGYDFDAETNVVDVYIRYLREKLSKIGKKDLIETVRGSGYRIVVLSPVQAEQKRALELSVVSWTAVMATVLLAAGLVITYLTGFLAVQRTQGPNFEQIALQTAKKTDVVIENEIDRIRNLSVAPDLRDALRSKSAVPRFAKHIADIRTLQPDVISEITVVNETGEAVASTDPKISGAFGKADWYVKGNTLKAGRVGISDITYLSGRPVIDMYTPIYDGGNKLGVLKVTSELQGLFASITKVRVDKTGHTMLVDSKGVVVICPIFVPRSHQLAKPLLDSIVGSDSGWRITDDNPHGGKRSIAGFASVEITTSDIAGTQNFGDKTWHVLLSQSPKETYSHVFDSLWRAFVAGASAVVIITLVAYLAGRRIIRPGTAKRKFPA